MAFVKCAVKMWDRVTNSADPGGIGFSYLRERAGYTPIKARIEKRSDPIPHFDTSE